MPSPDSTPELKPGIYQHYKGGQYLVLSIGILESTDEPHVIYISLVESSRAGRIWIRALDDFTASVTVNGLIKPRFSYVGPAI